MEKKDIIILAAAFVLAGFSLYRKYAKKQGGRTPDKSIRSFAPKGGLRDQPDDYEPYSAKKRS